MNDNREATLPAGPKARRRANETKPEQQTEEAAPQPARDCRDHPTDNPGQPPALSPKPKQGKA